MDPYEMRDRDKRTLSDVSLVIELLPNCVPIGLRIVAGIELAE
jgi:hypothetical protein